MQKALQNLSKEELIELMFGEEEESATEVVATKEDFVNGDNDNDDSLTHIYSWTDTVVLWQEKDTQEYLFEVDNIEYDINNIKQIIPGFKRIVLT